MIQMSVFHTNVKDSTSSPWLFVLGLCVACTQIVIPFALISSLRYVVHQSEYPDCDGCEATMTRFVDDYVTVIVHVVSS